MQKLSEWAKSFRWAMLARSLGISVSGGGVAEIGFLKMLDNINNNFSKVDKNKCIVGSKVLQSTDGSCQKDGFSKSLESPRWENCTNKETPTDLILLYSTVMVLDMIIQQYDHI